MFVIYSETCKVEDGQIFDMDKTVDAHLANTTSQIQSLKNPVHEARWLCVLCVWKLCQFVQSLDSFWQKPIKIIFNN